MVFSGGHPGSHYSGSDATEAYVLRNMLYFVQGVAFEGRAKQQLWTPMLSSSRKKVTRKGTYFSPPFA